MKRLALAASILFAIAMPALANGTYSVSPANLNNADPEHSFTIQHDALPIYEFRAHGASSIPANWHWMTASAACFQSCDAPALQIRVEVVAAQENDCRQASLVWEFNAPFEPGNRVPVKVLAGGCLYDDAQAAAFYEQVTGSEVPNFMELAAYPTTSPSPSMIAANARAIRAE